MVTVRQGMSDRVLARCVSRVDKMKGGNCSGLGVARLGDDVTVWMERITCLV